MDARGVFWTALAVGVLLKGPLIVMIVGLAAGALIASIAPRAGCWTLKPLAGIIWLALLVLPWFLAIVARAGDDVLRRVGRAGLARQGFRRPGIPWRSARHLFRAVLADVLAGRDVGGIGGAGDLEARAASPRASSCWPGWCPHGWCLELVATKLPHYVLPLYPAIAILIAGVIDAHICCRAGPCWCGARSGGSWFPWSRGSPASSRSPSSGGSSGCWYGSLMGGAAVMGFLAWRLYQADGAEHSLLRAIAAAVLTAIAIFALVVPSLGQLFPSVTLARILRDSGCAQPAAAAVGYQEPSSGLPRRHDDPPHRYRGCRGIPARR